MLRLFSSKDPFTAADRRSQASQEAQSLHRVLDLPRGLFPVGHAPNTSGGSHPAGIRTRWPNRLTWLLIDVEEERL